MAESSRAEDRWIPVREFFRKSRVLWWTLGVIVLAALLVVILWKVPQWQVGQVKDLAPKEWFDRVNEARKTLATILGGVVLLLGGFATWRNLRLAQESLRISQEGQITDRFTKAIEQLGAVDGSGKKKLEVRLGGIYALERIANQSERDHWPIVEVLSTYVRENAPLKPQASAQENQASAVPPPGETQESTQENQASTALPHLAADIQAILTVLGRRDRKYERKGQVLDLTHTDVRGAYLGGTDLSRADLREASLSGAILFKADLSEANLRGAILFKADLSEANLRGADIGGAVLLGADLRRAFLSGADLWNANLSEARLWDADLSGAYLNEANLSAAKLRGANLSGAFLWNANLREAKGLTQEQVDAAKGHSDTKLPDNLHMPESWKT